MTPLFEGSDEGNIYLQKLYDKDVLFLHIFLKIKMADISVSKVKILYCLKLLKCSDVTPLFGGSDERNTYLEISYDKDALF